MATYSKQCSAVGSFNYASRFTLYVVLTNRDGNPATNKSIVDYDVYFENTSGGGTFTSNTRLYFALNGTGIKDSTSSITGPRNGRVSIASGSIEVTHDNDGRKSIGYHALVNSTSFGIYGEISGNFELTTIPRASSISGGSGNIGEKTTITISRASANFTHILKYAFGNLSGTIASGVSTSYDWTIPTTFYAQIPNSKTGTGTISCETYNNGTLIGTKSVQFTATATETNCRPTVSATIKDTNSKTTALTGNSSKLVKHRSTAQLVITSTVKNSATIKSVTVNGTNVGTGSSITLNYSNVSADSFTIVTTDSRGYTNTSYVLTPTYVNYVPLTVNANFFRPQPTTGEVKLTYSGNYFNGSFGSSSNTLSITWKYKETTASSYTTGGTITPTLSGNTISSKTISLGTTFNYQKAYDFQLIAVDKLTTTTVNATISIGLPVFNWGKDFFNVNGDVTANTFKGNLNGTSTKANQDSDGKSLQSYYLRNFNRTMAKNAINLNDPGINGMFEVRGNELEYTNAPYNGYYPFLNIKTPDNIAMFQIAGRGGTMYYRGYQNADVNMTGVDWTKIRDSKNWGVTLFENSAGDNGTITLSDSASNYSYMEVYFSTNRNQISYNCQKIQNPNGKDINLNAVVRDATQEVMYMESSLYNIGGTSMPWRTKGSSHNYANNVGYYNSNTIYIFKVVGYK